MSLGVETVIQIAGYIRTAFIIYQEIKAVPGEVAELKKQLEEFGKPLSSLQSELADQSREPLGGMDDQDRDALVSTVRAAAKDCLEVRDLFSKLKNRQIGYIGGHDLKARTDWLAHAWFKYGFGADKVKDLILRIDKRRITIDFSLNIIGVKSQKQIQKEILAMKREQATMLKLLQSQSKQKAIERDALLNQIKSLEEKLAKEREEAKKAKARECLGGKAKATGSQQPEQTQPATKNGGPGQLRNNKEPPGPGNLSKTPSMGPVVIRGQPATSTKDEKAKQPKNKTTPKKQNPKDPGVKNQGAKASSPSPGSAAASLPIPVQHKPRARSPAPPQPPTSGKSGASAGHGHVKIINVDKPPSPDPSDKKRRTPRPSPSPSPAPPGKKHSIMFVDPTNFGRSVVCHTMLVLLALWGREGGNDRIEQVHSAGFFTKRGGDCIAEIKGLDYSRPSYNLGISEGDEVMNVTACNVLFASDAGSKDGSQPWWQGGTGSNKADVEKLFRSRPSTGMQRGDFKRFDYIVCFTQREYENLVQLRSAVVAKDGKVARPKGKGRILHLGRYFSADGAATREIFEVVKPKRGDRGAWAAKVTELRAALEGFLRQELKWDLPTSAIKTES